MLIPKAVKNNAERPKLFLAFRGRKARRALLHTILPILPVKSVTNFPIGDTRASASLGDIIIATVWIKFAEREVPTRTWIPLRTKLTAFFWPLLTPSIVSSPQQAPIKSSRTLAVKGEAPRLQDDAAVLVAQSAPDVAPSSRAMSVKHFVRRLDTQVSIASGSADSFPWISSQGLDAAKGEDKQNRNNRKGSSHKRRQAVPDRRTEDFNPNRPSNPEKVDLIREAAKYASTPTQQCLPPSQERDFGLALGPGGGA